MALSRLDTDIAGHFFADLAHHYDLRPRLAEIGIPTLVITGRHDWVCRPAGGRAIANAVRGAELVELPRAGHFGFSETPRPFRAAVRAHLARIAAAQPGSAINERRAATPIAFRRAGATARQDGAGAGGPGPPAPAGVRRSAALRPA